MERVQRIATGAIDGNIIAAIIAVHMATNATNDIPIVPAPLPMARTWSRVTIQASTVNATIAVQAGAASRSKSLTRADGFSAFTSQKSRADVLPRAGPGPLEFRRVLRLGGRAAVSVNTVQERAYNQSGHPRSSKEAALLWISSG